MHGLDRKPPAVILIVEGEGIVLLDLSDTLTDAGFQVIEATNGPVALRILDAHPEIRVLFSHLHLPGPWSGIELAHRARERRSDLGIVLTSSTHSIQPDDAPPGTIVIPKPCRPLVIIEALKQSAPRAFHQLVDPLPMPSMQIDQLHTGTDLGAAFPHPMLKPEK
jgi:CheY-like chemotaxis protein